MKYVLTEAFKNELKSRKDYIESALNLWTIAKEVNGNVEFHEFPTPLLDIFFIYGHNIDVQLYLFDNFKLITESIIVIITCYDKDYFSNINFGSKAVYIARQNESKYAELVRGDEYGFEINITLSELIFYRTKHEKNLITRLNNSFRKIK